MATESQIRPRPPIAWMEYLQGVLIVAACTIVAILLRSRLESTNLVMVFLVGLVVIAARYRQRVAILASVLSVAAFDYFCVPPYLTFAVEQSEYIITFAVMLGVALFISATADSSRRLAIKAEDREKQTSSLHNLSTNLAGLTRLFDIVQAAAELAEETFHSKVAVFLPDQNGTISFSKRTSSRLIVPSSEHHIAQWAFDHGEPTGRNTTKFPTAAAMYVPIKSERRVFAVMAFVSPSGELPSQDVHLLDVFLGQTAQAIERAIAASTAQQAEIRVETESLRTSLLSAVSHDLRTPLASITGAAATLKTHWANLDTQTQSDLLTTVTVEADRLNRLLNNLLEVTKLESGVKLHKERFPLEEIVGSALHRLKAQIENRPVLTALPRELPLVPMDALLIEQVFINLLDNALKYTPEGTSLEIAARTEGTAVEVEVRDRGHGFAPGTEDVVFDKFFRGRTDGTRGAGLGLAICKAIIDAHSGTIEAANREGGGAIIRFRLPTAEEERPAEVPVGRFAHE